MLPVGSMVAGYRIERVLGTGGMGTVYLAKNPVLPRHDALKLLSVKLSGDPGFRERFVREADIASVLDHPNIVSIYSRGETDDGHLWIAMQYVPGTDAEAALRAGTMTPIRAVHIVGEVAKALDFAHQRNVVHHDVKPANFLLSDEAGEDEKVLLGDFGTARALDDVGMSMTGSLTATLAYAAPEVIAGGPIDGRADLYSLGCTLFRMLTGKKPFFEADGMAAEMMAHLHDDPPRVSEHLPWAPPQLDWVITKALAKDPIQRFQSAREFAHAAAAALHEAVPAVAPPQPGPRSSQPSPSVDHTRDRGGGAEPGHFGTPASVSPLSARRITKPAVFLGAAGLAVVALVGGLAFWLLRPSPATPDSAINTTTPSTAPASTPADPEAQARLNRLLPPGYPPGTCTPIAAPEGVLAKVSCDQNADPGGPPSATYTLVRDKETLRIAFDEVVQTSTVVNCPGGIQSPGPWRHNATPNMISGTLVCGVQQSQPTVAWTDDAKLLVSAVQSGPQGPALDQLYAWWSSHS
ncbi:MAG: serine/threonine-protein kinase [Mycobacterium sp.]